MRHTSAMRSRSRLRLLFVLLTLPGSTLRCRSIAAVGPGISAARREMQPDLRIECTRCRQCAKKSRAGINWRGYAWSLIRSPAMRATTNFRSRLRYRVADDRVIDVEAKKTGVVLIVQPDRHRILCDRGQVEPGRLDVQVPATASVGSS